MDINDYFNLQFCEIMIVSKTKKIGLGSGFSFETLKFNEKDRMLQPESDTTVLVRRGDKDSHGI